MYKETLMDQWRNLYNDFEGTYEVLAKKENAVAEFNRWYEARVHRWNSISYTEGLLLEQEKNPEFSEDLKTLLNSFQFNKVEDNDNKGLLPGVIAGAVCGVGVAAAFSFFHWGKTKAIVSGVIVAAVIISGYAKRVSDLNEKGCQHTKESYVRQLKDFQIELSALCDEYHID